MSEQWRGLHNHDRHDDYTQEECYCNQCDEACFPPDPCLPCRCCLAAEVEALRAQVAAVREVCDRQMSRQARDPRYVGMYASIALAHVYAALDGPPEWLVKR